MVEPATAALLCDFLHGAVHLILHARKVYPPEIFERRRFLDVTVFRSRHVELNDHIALVARGARDLMARGEADALRERAKNLEEEVRQLKGKGVQEKKKLPPEAKASHHKGKGGAGKGKGSSPSSSSSESLDALSSVSSFSTTLMPISDNIAMVSSICSEETFSGGKALFRSS